MARAPAVGIDFGAVNSCIAVFRNGKVEIITNDYGNRTTPSCVAFIDTELCVGDSAKCQTTINLKNTVFNFKGLIGRSFYDSDIQNEIKYKPYTIINDKGKPKIQVEYKESKTETFYPEEITSMVFMKIKRLVEDYLKQTVTHAVITVPSYFNSLQQQSIKIAGLLAGFDVMRVINEPTVAAVAYYFNEKVKQEKNILICDLGGSSSNVSVLTIGDGIFEVKATVGENHLGGEDFNERMFNYFVLEFKKRYQKDLTSSERAAYRLRLACEKAKCMLSNSTCASIDIDYLYENLDFYTSISRVQFEELNADLFRSVIRVVEKSLQDAQINKTQIDEVVLVGGSNRIPKIQELLQEFFNGKHLNQSVNKEEAVAYGAAIQAAILYGDHSEEIQDMLLLDVTSFSRGIENASGVMVPVIKRNATIPTKQTESFTDYSSDKDRLFIKVYEGESAIAKNNLFLGEFELTNILSASYSVPEIDVTFSVDANNNLSVTVTEKSTNKTMEFAVTKDHSHFSKEDVECMTEKAKKYRLEKQKKYASSKSALKSYFTDVKNAIKRKGNM